MKRLLFALLLIPGLANAQSTAVKIWDGTDFAGVTGGALDVNATVSTTGLATEAEQQAQTALLTTIDGDTGSIATSTSSIDSKITACNTGAVVVSSGSLTCNAGTNLNTSALATEASLASLNGKVTACNTGAVTISSALPAGSNNIGDVDAAQSGTWTVQPGNTANTTPWLQSIRPSTSGGLTTFHLVSAASTNATNIKASAGQLYGWYIYNSNAAARKVAFHNTAGTPTAGASVYFSVMLPPGSAANVFSETGMAFSTGIAITTVTEIADAGSTGVGADDLIINLWYN